MLKILITADTNDGDYVTEENDITQEQIEAIRPIVKAIWANNGEWENGDVGDNSDYYIEVVGEDLFNLFNDFAPFGEHGIHTIESIEIREVNFIEKL